MSSYFITGVDTDIGKTFISIGLLLNEENKGKKVGYFKPFQSGAYIEEGGEGEKGILKAPDVEELKKYSNIDSKYSYLFKGEVSPHLASVIDKVDVDIKKVKKDFIDFSKNYDLTIVEGAGGLYCPAYHSKLFKDVIKELDLEIIIVTTVDLGRLNHTLMTIDCAKRNNIKIKGIIINKMPKNPYLSEKYFIEELKMFTDVEILGIIPKIEKLNKENILNAFLDISL